MSGDGSRLAESLDELSDIAAEAGLDPAAARDEGLRVAAALAESVPGAASEWARVARYRRRHSRGGSPLRPPRAQRRDRPPTRPTRWR